jgi:putative endonuclease
MLDGQYLVFIEVRSRSDHRFGTPAETVSKIKQKRLIRTASYYLQLHSIHMPCRFDIIAITHKDQRHIVEWIKDAFQSV